MGHGRAPPRHEPLHGAADLLLLRRGHRHLQRHGPVHRHRRADEREGLVQHPRGDQRAVPRHEHQDATIAQPPSIPRWADAFPYVNGGLFSGSIDVPRFSRIARSYLLHIGSLDWTKINPDIFGSMIQAVADDEERGALGHALHQRAEHPEGAESAVPRRPARAAGGGGRQPPQAAQPAQAHGQDQGLRSGLRLGQLPGHRLQGDAGDRGRDQPAARRGRPAHPKSR